MKLIQIWKKFEKLYKYKKLAYFINFKREMCYILNFFNFYTLQNLSRN